MSELEITEALSRMRKITSDSSGWNILHRDDSSRAALGDNVPS